MAVGYIQASLPEASLWQEKTRAVRPHEGEDSLEDQPRMGPICGPASVLPGSLWLAGQAAEAGQEMLLKQIRGAAAGECDRLSMVAKATEGYYCGWKNTWVLTVIPSH